MLQEHVLGEHTQSEVRGGVKEGFLEKAASKTANDTWKILNEYSK